MEKNKKGRKVKVLLCVTAGFLALTVIVVGSGYTLVKKHKEAKIKAAHEAQVKENLKKAHDDEYVQAQMMDYLEERYHEKFVMKYYQCNRGGWYGNYVEMGVWPEGKEDAGHLFEVTGDPDAEGNLIYSDSYLDLRMGKEMEDYFQPYIDKYYTDYLSYSIFLSDPFTGSLPGDITLDELFEQKYEAHLYFDIHVEQQEMDSNLRNLDALAKELQENKFRGRFRVALNETKKINQMMSHIGIIRNLIFISLMRK